jgi:hypothetical protein
MRIPFGRRVQAPAGDQPAGITPNPLALRLAHIDRELAALATKDRDPFNLAALDVWLDKRLVLKPAPGGEGGAR